MKKGLETVVYRAIGGKTAVWMPGGNRYVLAAYPADEVAKLIAGGRAREEIVDLCESRLGIERARAADLEARMRGEISEQAGQNPESGEGPAAANFCCSEEDIFSEKNYFILGCHFKVRFSSPGAEFLIHPRFAHLECGSGLSDPYRVTVSYFRGWYALQTEDGLEGAWPERSSNRLIGRFFMMVLEKTFMKKEDQWMAVLHAAGVVGGSSCVVFAGDTGAGKSTLAALLLSVGFEVFADDFLPIEAVTGRACSFPAAISVKQDSIGVLESRFPLLKTARTYHYSELGKTVRYLPPGGGGAESPKTSACKGLVFVKYDPGTSFCLEEIPPEEAFARLVPDIWIYPSRENAARFLNWFSDLSCYRVNYHDYDKMVKAIGDLIQGSPSP